MVYDYFEKYTFLCEMYDEEADEVKDLVLNFFPFDNSVQITDTKIGKNLVRRVQFPPLKLEMLQIGNIVNIFSKMLYIKDCAPATRKTLFHNVQRLYLQWCIVYYTPLADEFQLFKEILKHCLLEEMFKEPLALDVRSPWPSFSLPPRLPRKAIGLAEPEIASILGAPSTFALIKPVPPSAHGKIITFIMKKGFRIVRMKNGKIDKDFAMELYKNVASSNMLPIIIDYVTAGEVIGLELVAPDAIKKWRECLGTTDPATAAPGTLRRLYGENKLKNVAHGCVTLEEASAMLDKFFGYEKGIPRIPFRATFKNCTCCIIRPHVIIDGNVGAILEQIATSEKFYIAAIAMFSVKLTNAEEFFEVYKGVLPEYEAMCIHLAEGKCIALEVKCTDPSLNCVCEFRKLCGPRDPELSRQLYPDSIRALYGKNIIYNAVHCTDLPEDGELEVEYFFKLLAND